MLIKQLRYAAEQPVYANLNELNIQVQDQDADVQVQSEGGESDADKTPTTHGPPFVPNGSGPKVR